MRDIPNAWQLHPDARLSVFSRLGPALLSVQRQAECLIVGLCSFGELKWRLLTDSICPVIASLMVFRQRNAFLMAPLAALWPSLIHSNIDALSTTLWPLRSQAMTFAMSVRPLWETGVTRVTSGYTTLSVRHDFFHIDRFPILGLVI